MLLEKEIKFNGSPYKIKMCNGVIEIFESLTDKNIHRELAKGKESTLLVYVYSLLKFNNQAFNYTYEEFRDLCDENDGFINEYQREIFDVYIDYKAKRTPDAEKKTKKK